MAHHRKECCSIIISIEHLLALSCAERNFCHDPLHRLRYIMLAEQLRFFKNTLYTKKARWEPLMIRFNLKNQCYFLDSFFKRAHSSAQSMPLHEERTFHSAMYIRFWIVSANIVVPVQRIIWQRYCAESSFRVDNDILQEYQWWFFYRDNFRSLRAKCH